MEGILVLMIPVLAMATGLVTVLRMPPERLGNPEGAAALPEESAALADEVAMLREELAQLNERVDFAERLLMDAAPAQRLAAPAPADPIGKTIGA